MAKASPCFVERQLQPNPDRLKAAERMTIGAAPWAALRSGVATPNGLVKVVWSLPSRKDRISIFSISQAPASLVGFMRSADSSQAFSALASSVKPAKVPPPISWNLISLGGDVWAPSPAIRSKDRRKARMAS